MKIYLLQSIVGSRITLHDDSCHACWWYVPPRKTTSFPSEFHHLHWRLPPSSNGWQNSSPRVECSHSPSSLQQLPASLKHLYNIYQKLLNLSTIRNTNLKIKWHFDFPLQFLTQMPIFLSISTPPLLKFIEMWYWLFHIFLTDINYLYHFFLLNITFS